MWSSPEARRWLLVLLVSAAFTAIGIWLALAGHTKGWLTAIFFGACTAVALVSILPGVSGAKLDTKVSALLARYPSPAVLRPSRRKWLLLLLASAAFAATGAWLALEWQIEGWLAAILWLFAVFFGTGAVAAMAQLLPGANGLKLDTEGFETTQLFRRRHTRWQDASGFTPVAIPPSGIALVGYDDANAETGTVAEINRSITGRNAALPDTYGFSAEVLASLMTQWRDRALQPASTIDPELT